MGLVLNYPVQKETSVDTELRFAPLPPGTRDPVTYTITAAVAGTSVTDVTVANGNDVQVGDTTITINALSANIPNRAKIEFNNGVNVRLTAAASATDTTLTVEAVQAVDRDQETGVAIPAATVGAYNAGTLDQNTQYLSVTALPVALWVGEVLNFGGTEVTVTDDVPAGASEIEILPLSAAITQGTTASTLATYYIAGATDASPSSNPKLVDATTFTSGAGNEQLITGTNRTLSFTFQDVVGDPGVEFMKQILYNDERFDREVYAILRRKTEQVYEGACIPTQGDQSSPVQDIVTITANLQFQGRSFRYTPNPNAPTVFAS
ncbi:MAG: hypothetical protein AAFU78_14580 [Cyanobacteria bacterium J06633_2]